MNDIERYDKACHAMQSGVAMKMNYNDTSTQPKHLRVGVNSAMAEHSALVSLLVNKGIITEAEYFKELADAMEREVARYEKELSDHFGTIVNLA